MISTFIFFNSVFSRRNLSALKSCFFLIMSHFFNLRLFLVGVELLYLNRPYEENTTPKVQITANAGKEIDACK